MWLSAFLGLFRVVGGIGRPSNTRRFSPGKRYQQKGKVHCRSRTSGDSVFRFINLDVRENMTARRWTTGTFARKVRKFGKNDPRSGSCHQRFRPYIPH
ncbi:hypothetical protein pipiens_012692 [Culex pipiens pipiens]|uniref:Secreted protein n=1 Tax=Culex pipiens pipiens TaxID=38569 RepID=A0ABD1D1C5_CULPP